MNARLVPQVAFPSIIINGMALFGWRSFSLWSTLCMECRSWSLTRATMLFGRTLVALVGEPIIMLLIIMLLMFSILTTVNLSIGDLGLVTGRRFSRF